MTLFAHLMSQPSSYQVHILLQPSSEIQCRQKQPNTPGWKLVVAHLSSKAGYEAGNQSSKESHKELMNPLCVQTTALAQCVGGDLHAVRTAIGILGEWPWSMRVDRKLITRLRSQTGLNRVKRRRARHRRPPPHRQQSTRCIRLAISSDAPCANQVHSAR